MPQYAGVASVNSCVPNVYNQYEYRGLQNYLTREHHVF